MSLRKSGADCPYDAGELMRRGVLALVVLLLACVLMAGAVSATGITEITSKDDLIALATAVNDGEDYSGKTVILKSDVEIITTGTWFAIGNKSSKSFNGTFDGGGKTITFKRNVTSNYDDRYNGLFTYAHSATFKNLKIVADTSGLRSPLTYQVNNTTFTNIDVSGTIKNCNQIGSLVGYLAIDSTFTDCKSSADLVIEPSDKSGKYRLAGGLVSQVASMIRVWNPTDLSSKYAAEFTNCKFSGKVTAKFNTIDQSLTDRWLYVGGLIAGTTYNDGNTYFAVKFTDCTVTNEDYLTTEKTPPCQSTSPPPQS